MSKLDNISGVILVGGKSLRMGRDKALLELGGVFSCLAILIGTVVPTVGRGSRWYSGGWSRFSV